MSFVIAFYTQHFQSIWQGEGGTCILDQPSSRGIGLYPAPCMTQNLDVKGNRYDVTCALQVSKISDPTVAI